MVFCKPTLEYPIRLQRPNFKMGWLGGYRFETLIDRVDIVSPEFQLIGPTILVEWNDVA